MINYISEEDAAYTKLMEWARTQKDAINEEPYDFWGHRNDQIRD